MWDDHAPDMSGVSEMVTGGASDAYDQAVSAIEQARDDYVPEVSGTTEMITDRAYDAYGQAYDQLMSAIGRAWDYLKAGI